MKRLLAILVAAAAAACGLREPQAAAGPTAADAKSFLDTVNQTTMKLGIEEGRAGWVQQTYITDDTEVLSAHATQAAVDAGVRFAKDSTRFDRVEVPADQRRQLNLLKTSLVLATPADAKQSDELTTIMARLESTYGKGKWC
ncbi:MAG TPA: M2 family metallopeptidase, partial [Vicinamibacterales bacterium]